MSLTSKSQTAVPPLQDRFGVKRGRDIVYVLPEALTDVEIDRLIARFSMPGLRDPGRWQGQARALQALKASR